jgi:hypothetical protein
VRALLLASRQAKTALTSNGASSGADHWLYRSLNKRGILSNAFRSEAGHEVPADVGKQVSRCWVGLPAAQQCRGGFVLQVWSTLGPTTLEPGSS